MYMVTPNARVWDAALMACKIAGDKEKFDEYLDDMGALGIAPLRQGAWTGTSR